MDNDVPYKSTEHLFTPRTSRHEDAEAEYKATLEQVPLLKDVLEHFEASISATDSVKNALIIAKQYELGKEEVLAAMDVIRKRLEVEKSYIEGRIKALPKTDEDER